MQGSHCVNEVQPKEWKGLKSVFLLSIRTSGEYITQHKFVSVSFLNNQDNIDVLAYHQKKKKKKFSTLSVSQNVKEHALETQEQRSVLRIFFFFEMLAAQVLILSVRC